MEKIYVDKEYKLKEIIDMYIENGYIVTVKPCLCHPSYECVISDGYELFLTKTGDAND